VIAFAEVGHLFQDFKHTAWRLETRKGYASDRRSPSWSRWLGGEDVAHDAPDPWRQNVAAQVATGKRFERVRLVDEPPTKGQQFLLARVPSNIAAGEDIRMLPRMAAGRLALPEYDFWLFDSRLLVRFIFDQDDTTLGVEVTEDPSAVVAACQARDAAWHHAVPSADFAQRVRSTV
jgi:hypothetical protein